MWRSDGALTVGWGETFCYIGGSPSQKRFKIFDLDLPQPVPPLFHSVPTVWDHRSLQIAILANLGSFWAVFGSARLPRLFTFPKSNDCVLRFSGDGLGEVTEEIVSSRPRYLCRYAIRLQHCLQVLSSPSFNKKTFCAKNGYFITTREGFVRAPWKGDKNILSMPGASYSS